MSCTCNAHGPYNCIDIVPIFQHLTGEEMAQVAAITTECSFGKGEIVYRVGDRRGKLFVLHTGSVKVYRLTVDGKEQVLRIVSPGEFLGELSLFSPNTQTDTAVSLEPTRMCSIEWTHLRSLMESIPSIAFKVMEQLSGRLEKTESLLEQTNLSTVEQRLANYLIQSSVGRNSFTLGLSKGDLASLLGMTHETLSRRLSVFQQERMIELHGHRGVTILDRTALEQLIEGVDDE